MTTEARPRLLIVDDEGAQLRAMCTVLEEAGFSVSGFGSPTAALRAVRPEQFDVVLTDLMMPEMDGIELLRELQKLDPDVVLVVMTGNGALETAIQAMKAGALDYVLKPFRLAVLMPVIARALDIRRLRRENAELRRRERLHLSQLEVANEELEAFSYTVSHDLRAPLRVIGGYADILSTDGSLNQDARECVATISQGTRRMNQLIEDLLNFSRLSQHAIKKQLVDVAALVTEVVAEIRADSGGNAEVLIGELPQAVADSALLRQVLINLLSNAFKFTSHKDAPLIRVDGYSQGDERVYFVRDNGAGFSQQDAAKLFGVFQRLHEKRDFAGTGVGLSIVRRIVQRHGGRVWAEGERGKGATFFFSLPRLEHAGGSSP